MIIALITLSIIFLLSIPLGYYLKFVIDAEFGGRIIDIDALQPKSFLHDIIIPIIACSAFFLFVTFFILRFQQHLPLNPNNALNLSTLHALNLAISFITTTNLQIVTQSVELSYLSQCALSLSTLVGSIIGIIVAFVIIRSLADKSNRCHFGNFYNDALNLLVMVFIPMCTILSLVFISQGSIQNFIKDVIFVNGDGIIHIISQGPAATFESIKIIGVNGGGFFDASSAHPFENPNEFTNLLQIIMMSLIPASLLVCYGIKCDAQKQSYIYLAVFLLLMLLATSIVEFSERNPIQNLVGKESQFDITGSALYNTVSVFSSGSSNSNASDYSHTSLFIFLLSILLNNLVFGGAGIGFINLTAFIILTAFIAGLMSGRVSVIFGKKIGVQQVAYISLYLLTIQICIFAFTYINIKFAFDPLAELPAIFFNIVSAVANNGSSLELLDTNQLIVNSTTICMFFGRIMQLTVGLGIANSFFATTTIQNKLYGIKVDSPFFLVLLMFILAIHSIVYMPIIMFWPLLEILQ